MNVRFTIQLSRSFFDELVITELFINLADVLN